MSLNNPGADKKKVQASFQISSRILHAARRQYHLSLCALIYFMPNSANWVFYFGNWFQFVQNEYLGQMHLHNQRLLCLCVLRFQTASPWVPLSSCSKALFLTGILRALTSIFKPSETHTFSGLQEKLILENCSIVIGLFSSGIFNLNSQSNLSCLTPDCISLSSKPKLNK